MRHIGGWFVFLTLVLGPGLAPLLAQVPPETPEGDAKIGVQELPDAVVVNFSKEGVAFEDFVQTAAELLDVSFVYDQRKVANKRVNMIGAKRVKKEDLFAFFQTIFFAHEMAVVSLGPPEAEVLLIEDIKTSQILKQRAVYVSVAELERRRRNVGEIIATTIQLKHIPVEKAQRALTNIIQEHRAGFVHPIEESNSLLVTNFAPTVWSMYEIIQAMDVEVEGNQLNFEKLALEYHVAEELATTLDELMQARSDITASGGRTNRSRQPAQPQGAASAPPAKIIPDGRTNSLLVYAVDEDMTEIRMLVAALDIEGTEVNSNIHIHELKNTNAEDMQSVLTDLLGQTGGASARPSGAGGSRTNNNANRGAAGNGTDVDPNYVNIVADPHTNSLLITSTQARFEEVREIIERLDRRRPQVLVQCAIAELSDNDIENIGVEVAQIEGGGAEARLFGGTAFGLSTITTQSDLNGTGGDGMGGGTSTNNSNFFEDLVRIPNLDGQGLTAGIFQNFVGVPLLVRLFQENRRSNLVSVPSILVNDNEEAHIIVGNEIPTTTVNQGQFSDQTSFGGYQEANLELSISPHISNDDYLRLDIFLNVQAFDGAQVDPAVPPPRTTREIQTQITVPSGRTIVIGGLTNDNQRETVSGIPLLSDIPILGELFKNTSTQHEKRTLYVFITPTIMSDFESLDRVSYERKLEIAKLDGQIHIVDPNFREIELDSKEVTIEEIESTGSLNMPRYRPSSAVEGDMPKLDDGSQVPVRPKSGLVAPRDEGASSRAEAAPAGNAVRGRLPDAKPARAGGF
ncbi:MAG: secretin N-terminal domain-containing protein [Planctomycetota bacterium]